MTALIAIALASSAGAQTPRSTITIHVGKSGVFSGFGHDHVVVAPIAHGSVDAKAMVVEITVITTQMKVTDSDASEKDRAEVQKTMLGPKVLDADKFPEIHFKSSRVQQTSPRHFRVTGKLSLQPAGCLEWTDGCRVCARQKDGSQACSNVGIACVPREARCTRP